MMLPPFSRQGASGDQKGPRMTLLVGVSPDSLMWRFESSVTTLENPVSPFRSRFRNCHRFWWDRAEQEDLRFQTNHIAHAVHLIASGGADLPHRVQEVDACQPFFRSQIDLTRKRVDMSDHRRKDLLRTWSRVGAHGVDDMLGEVGIKLLRVELGKLHDARCSRQRSKR
jgi:hypothetical protein